MAKDNTPLETYYVRYAFCDSHFHHVVNAKDPSDAMDRTIVQFRKDGYPMEKLVILGAVPYVLVEGKL